ncbi:MAG: endonuclease III [Candidatus Babeliales bacterium]|jgi:endonuclease-3
MMNHISDIVQTLRRVTKKFPLPLADAIVAEYGKDPYLILISCLLSLRAKDSMTIHVCHHLFARAHSPQQMVALSQAELEKLVYRTGFYKTKARVVHNVSAELIEKYRGKVPSSKDALLVMQGVGPKTANLVMALAFGQPEICVDTHVHRISNRLGLVRTKKVEDTEASLRIIMPKKYWIEWNSLLVMWGQNVCTPQSPWCSRCAVRQWCKRVGVTKTR